MTNINTAQELHATLLRCGACPKELLVSLVGHRLIREAINLGLLEIIESVAAQGHTQTYIVPVTITEAIARKGGN